MAFDLDQLEKKRRELREQIETFETQKKIVRATIEKLTARYNIGEIGFKEYQEEYKRIFKDKTPEQWVNHYNIQIKSCEAQFDWYGSEIKKAKKELGRRQLAEREKEVKKREVQERIQKAEGYKRSVLSNVQDLVKKYNAREITFEQYQTEVKKLYGGNEPQKLVDYYDDYIKKAKGGLSAYEKPRTRSKFMKVIPLFLIMGMVLFGIFSFVLRSEFTGLSIQMVDEVHTKTYDLVLEESAIYDFDLPYRGSLNWLKLSGRVTGDGTVRIYLDDLLILDSEELGGGNVATMTGSVITGFVTEGEADSESADESASSESEGSADAGETSSDGEPALGEESPEDEGEGESEGAQDGEENETGVEGQTGGGEQGGGANESVVLDGNETVVLDGNESEQSDESGGGSPELPVQAGIKFKDYCSGSCDIKDFGLNKTSYSMRIEITNARLELDEIRYEVTVEREAEENVTITEPPKMIKEIPPVFIEKNQYHDLDVNEYFAGAVDYYLKQTDDISTTAFGSTIRIQPNENFTGVRESRIVVVNEFGSYGSNLFNITVFDSENATEVEMNASNATFNVTTKQYKAIINRPVRWVKKVDIEGLDGTEELRVELPKEAVNISIKTGGDAERALLEAGGYDGQPTFGITGNVVGELRGSKGLLTRLFEWVGGLTMTGRTISEEELSDEIIEGANSKIIDVAKVAERTDESQIVIEYYTSAPTAVEEEMPNGKRVTVSASHELNYTDILAYTVFDEGVEDGSIEIYWHASYEDAVRYGHLVSAETDGAEETEIVEVQNVRAETNESSVEEVAEDNSSGESVLTGNSFLTGFAVSGFDEPDSKSEEYYLIPIEFDVYDFDEDGRVDYVEWIVPHLSNQTFTIVINSSTSVYSEIIAIDNGYVHLTPLNVAPYDKLLLYLSFDADSTNEDATTHYDFSRYERDPSGVGNARANLSKNCIYEQCAHFDGDGDFINLGGPLVAYSTNYTISLWFRFPAKVPAGNYPVFYSEGNASNSESLAFYFNGDTTSIEAIVSGAGGVIPSVSGGFATDDKAWHHAVFVKLDSTHYQLFVDGVNVNNYTGFGHGPLHLDNGFVGNLYSNGINHPMKGSLDEVMVFNSSLTAAQITGIYRNQSTRFASSGEVAVLQFNLSQGQDKINISFKNYKQIGNTLISAGVGYWDVSKGYNISESSLVSYWNFDESNWSGKTDEVKDATTWKHDGTPSGITNTTPNGYFYRAGYFPGGVNDYVSINSYSQMRFNPKRNWTWSFWINPRQMRQQGLYSDGEFDKLGIEFFMESDGKISLVEPASPSTLSSVRSAPLNTWTHVAFVYNGSVSIYINGDPDATSSIAFSASNSVPKIGFAAFPGHKTFNGTMDEFMIFNRSLSAQEIKDVYVRSRAQWNHTSFQSLSYAPGSTNESLNEFSISRDATNLYVRTILSSDNMQFRTPLLYTSSVAPGYLYSFDLSNPLIEFAPPTPEDGSYVTEKSFPVNLTSYEEFDSYSFIELGRDLLLWMRLDDFNEESLDASSYSREATINGTPSMIDGVFGGAYDFEKSSNDRLHVKGLLPALNNFTTSFWFKSNLESAEGDIFVGDYSEDGGWKLGTSWCGGGQNSNPDDVMLTLGCANQVVTSCYPANVDDSEWHFISVSVNRTGLAWFVDGNLSYSNFSFACSPSSSTQEFHAASNSTSGKLNGALDEILLFNRTLTPAELSSLYHTVSPLFTNITSSRQGLFNLTGYIVDANGNMNFTSRSITLDNVAPAVVFGERTPEQESYTNETYFGVVVDATDFNQFYSTISLNRDILLYIRMDDINASGDPTDISPYSNNGTRKGDAIQTDSGYWGKGFVFDDTDDYVDFGTRLNLTGVYSISAWVYHLETESNEYIISQAGNVSGDFDLLINNLNRITFRRYTGAGTQQNWFTTAAQYLVPLNQWTHIVAVWNGTRGNIYFNGALTTTSSASGASNIPPQNLTISHINNEFNGTIDEVIIFDRVLTAREIAALYNASATSYEMNFSGLDDQEYAIHAYSADKFGNLNGTEERTFWVDRTSPLIDFESPTPLNSSLLMGGVLINISTTDATSDVYAFFNLDNSLMLWYDMDTVNATGDPQDLSGSENHGQAWDGATQSQSGKFGESFRVDSTLQYVRAPAIDANLTANGFTQSMWFKLDSPPAAGQTDILSYFYANSQDSHYFRVTESVGFYTFSAHGEFNDDDYTITTAPMTASQITDSWHHFVSVYNLTHVTFYLNGVRIGADATSAVQSTSTFLMNYFGYDMNGRVDEVLLFNRTLTEAEVLALHNVTANGLEVSVEEEGEYKVKAYSVDRAGNKNSTEERVFSIVIPPVVSISTIYPSEDINVTQNEFFNVTLNVSCLVGTCGEVNVSLDPEPQGTWCYQETANASHPSDGDCDLNYGGSYSWSGGWTDLGNVYDGNWGTFDAAVGDYFYINYSKPTGALNLSLWQLKDSGIIRNLTIPSDCWDYSPTLVLRVYSAFMPQLSYWYCFNMSNSWRPLFTGEEKIYEEGIWWYVEDVPQPKSGLIPIGSGTPFYTNATSNPLTTSSLSEGQSEIITFWVNATGEPNIIHEFFAFANLTSDLSISNITEGWEVTIVPPSTAPEVRAVRSATSVNPIENGVTNVEINVSVYDENGYADVSLVYVEVARAGEPMRGNESCVRTQGAGNYANYSCIVGMWYFDEAGNWNITAVATDLDSLSGMNDTAVFQYNQLLAMVVSPNSLDFGTASTLGTEVFGPATYLNNTGNVGANISVEGHDLIGETISSMLFGVGNFTVGSVSGSSSCSVPDSATRLVNGSSVNVTNAYLPRGNHSINDGSTGQEIIYYCIPVVPTLPSQPYSTGTLGGWIIQMALAAFVRKLRKKKELDEDNLLEVLDEKLAEKYGVGLDEVLATIRAKKSRGAEEVKVPIDIFRQETGAAESLCKYLKENKGLNFSEIARAINRDPRTVWINYTNAVRKVSDRIETSSKVLVSTKIFRDRNLSISEALVYYLRSRGMKNAEVARMLGKDPRNVWTLYSRAVRKLGK